MRCRIVSSVSRPQAALAILVASLTLAVAQPAQSDNEAITISPELREALQDLLNYDGSRMAMGRATPLRVPSSSSSLDWKRSEKNDGSSAVTVK
jgi:hypothetical protein